VVQRPLTYTKDPAGTRPPETVGVPRDMLPVGSPERCYSTSRYLRTVWAMEEATRRDLERAMKELDDAEAWLKLPIGEPCFGTREAMYRAILGCTADEALASKPLPVALAERAVPAATADEVREKKRAGGKKAGRGRPIATASAAAPIKKPKGDSAARLTARIARDAPDVLARMKAGEFTTVVEAAREAGIATPKPTPVEKARKAIAKAPEVVLEALSLEVVEEWLCKVADADTRARVAHYAERLAGGIVYLREEDVKSWALRAADEPARLRLVHYLATLTGKTVS